MAESLEYVLVKSKRKSISLSVNKQGLVEVKAPFFISKFEVDRFVMAKSAWIEIVKNKINKLEKTPKAGNLQELKKQKLLTQRLIVERIKFFNPDRRFKINKVSIKNMTSRWGSCSSAGNLNFNYRLGYLDPDLLDYVVVHELCHLIEHNHGKRFWQEVRNILPDYKIKEKKVKQYLLC